MKYNRQYIHKNLDSLWEVMIASHLAFKKIVLQPQISTVLIYFCRYGLQESTVRKLLHEKKVPSRQTVHNAKTVLKKHGILIKKQEGKICEWTLAAPLNSVEITNTVDFVVRCKIL